MEQKISIKDVPMITRDKLNNILVPVVLIPSIGNQIAECSNNLTAILKVIESEVKDDAIQDCTANGSDEACQGEEP